MIFAFFNAKIQILTKFHQILIKNVYFNENMIKNGRYGTGTERVRVGGRSVFRRTSFLKNRIRDFLKNVF